MQGLPTLSVRLHGGLTPRHCVAQAQAAEAAGLDGIAFAENPFHRGILPATAACAVATSRIRIGAGVFNPYSRHPTLIAMDIGALDELAHGRVRLGIGSGIGWAIERMGFRYGRPLTTLREAIAIVRALLHGDEVSHAGAVCNVQKVKLDYRARADIPIFMAGRDTQSLQACGALADGLLVSNMCTAPFVAKAVHILQSAAQAAGRTAMPEVVQYLPCIIQPDRADAQRRAKQAVAEMLPAYWALGQRLPAAKRALLEGSDISAAELATAVRRLKHGEPAATVLDERYSAAFTIAGTAEDCRAQAAAYAAAGVTELALLWVSGWPRPTGHSGPAGGDRLSPGASVRAEPGRGVDTFAPRTPPVWSGRGSKGARRPRWQPTLGMTARTPKILDRPHAHRWQVL